MYKRHRTVLVILCCTAIASLVALAFILFSFFPSVTFEGAPPPIIFGCYKTGSGSVIFPIFVLIIAAQAGMSIINVLVSFLVPVCRSALLSFLLSCLYPWLQYVRA
ncbi:hypothetical protein BDN67DRAFT_438301 [Paxillus ammoniavirescens]|nr:hypothetical protein BDN67DRAFT_438301 [Paxillus ammoniavirescens]